MLTGILNVASSDQLDKLHDGVLHVLETLGLKLNSPVLLKKLAERGCEVDLEAGTVKFRPETVEAEIKRQSGRYRMVRSSLWYPFCEEEKEGTVSLPDVFACDYGYATPSVYDYDADLVREPTAADQIDMIRLGNALEGVRAVNAPFILKEFDSRIEVLESARLLMRHTPKPGWVGTYSAKQLEYLGMIAEIAVDGDEEKLKTAPPIVVTVMCTTSPLRLDNRSSDVLEAAIKKGFPINFSTMPILGATAPVTPAGAAVVAAAECLGGVVASSLINPEPYYYTASISSELDMRTTQICFSTPAAILTDALVHQLFRRKYGIVHCVEPAYIEAKKPGIQASYLKMFRLMAQAMCVSLPLPLGLLDNGSVFSPTQTIIDYDMNRAIYRFMQGAEVNDDTLALDTILEMKFAESESYLDREHTLSHFRDAIWDTRVFDRGAGAEEGKVPGDFDRELLLRADRQWKDLVANAPSYELEPYKEREVDRIVAAGIKDILG